MSPTVKLNPDPAGSGFTRFLIAMQQAKGRFEDALFIAKHECKTSPQVAEYIELHMKTAVGAGSTVTSHNLDDLAPYGPGAEFFSVLQSQSIALRLLARCRRVPFHVKVPKDGGTGVSGAWVGEGLPRPLVKSTTDGITQAQYTDGVIVAATRELFRFGRTSEVALRDIVTKAVAKYLDSQLLDPAVSASANVHPASITNGAPVVSTAGTSAANVITDLTAMIESLGTPGDSLVWIMRPLTYYSLLGKLAGVGFTQAPGMLFNIPVLLGSSSPRQITLVDADSIVVSYDPTIDVSISGEAALEMLDGSLTQTGLTGTGAQMVSTFQSSLVGVKAEFVCAWQSAFEMAGSPTQPAGVVYCVVTY